MNLLEALRTDRANHASRISGVVIGVVTRNKDPDNLGRVKVRMPRYSGEEESDWIRVATFMAGADRGAVFLPEPDDEVLIAFEMGDVNLPIIIGALHNGKDAAPYANEDGGNNKRVIQSRSGAFLRFDDSDGAEKVEISDGDEANRIVINISEKKITIESGQDIEVSAESGKISLKAREISLEASSELSLKSDGDWSAEGGDMKLEADEINLN